MRRFSPWLLVLGIAPAVMLFGCSKPASKLVSPRLQPERSSPAPLLGSIAVDARTKDSYIVVFKDAVADVDGEVDQIGQQFTIAADFRYKYALKGFAAKLPPTVVEAPRADPNVA